MGELVTAATPRPWRWQETFEAGVRRPRMFLDAIGRTYGHVLKITWPELLGDADAELIVRAVNEYDALIALETAIRRFRRDPSNIIHQDAADALAAIDKARS